MMIDVKHIHWDNHDSIVTLVLPQSYIYRDSKNIFGTMIKALFN